MDIRDFFAAVVPWDEPGFCSLHTLRLGVKGLPGRNFATLDEFMVGVAAFQASTERVEYYFALARHRGRRIRSQTFAFRSLFADLDVDPNNPDKYPDLQSAIAAVFNFCKEHGLPRPSAMVVSGGGLHVYWFSDRTIAIDQWVGYAEGLKQLCINGGLKIDRNVTADPARVLRIPGTKNNKEPTPRQVGFYQRHCPGTLFDFSSDFVSLLTVKPVGKLGAIPDALGDLDPDEDITAGMNRPVPLNLDRVKEKCAWLREVHELHGAGQPEPLWRDSLRIAYFFHDDAERLIYEFSDGHEDYTEAELLEKWGEVCAAKNQHNLGYPKCKTIRGDGCKHCDSCAYFTPDKSPLHLGMPTQEERVEQTIKDLGGTRPDELDLPDGFCVDENGHICAAVPAKKKNTPDILLPIIKTKIGRLSLQWQHGKYGLGFEALTEKGLTAQIFVANGDMYSGRAAGKLAEQLVMIPNDKLSRAYADVLTSGWVDKIRNYGRVNRDVETLGWRFDDGGKRIGFVYGKNYHHADNTATVIPAQSNDEFRQWYEPTGSDGPWLKAMRLLTERKRPELDVLISVGFAAPLMTFTGNVYGGILSCVGEPGTSKSCAQQLAAAVWGHPKMTRESLNSTPKSVQNRLGRIKNLAAYWDDIQSQDQQGFLNNTMFVSTQGVEGSRLNADASQKERKEWHTMLVACSNVSFVEYLLHVEKNTTAGIRRVFEFRIDRIEEKTGLIDPFEANKIFSALEHNYGTIGQQYAKWLAANHEKVEDFVQYMVQSFRHKVQGEPDENYWWSMCGVILAGAVLAKRWGGAMDVNAMFKFLLGAFEMNRTIRQDGMEAGTKLSTETIIKDYLNDYSGMGQVIYTDISRKSQHIPVQTLRASEKNRPIVAQVVRDERRIVMRKSSLKEYLFAKQLSGRGVIEGLKKHLDTVEVRFTIGGGTHDAQSTAQCYSMPVEPGSAFEPLLTAYGPVEPNMKLVR